MPDVASQSKIASSYAHSRAQSSASQRSSRADDRADSPFSDMLDSADTSQDTQSSDPVRKSDPAPRDDKSNSTGAATGKADNGKPDKPAAQDANAADTNNTDTAKAADGNTTTTGAATAGNKTDTQAVLEAALKDGDAKDASDSNDAKADKPTDPALIATVVSPVVAKPADPIAAALVLAQAPAEAGDKAATPDAAAAIGGLTPKLTPKLPAAPQGLQPAADNDAAVEAATPQKGEAKPQFTVKADEKIAAPVVATDAQSVHAAAEAKTSDTPNTQATAQITDAPTTAAATATVTTHPTTTATVNTANAAAAPSNTAQTAVAVPLNAVAVEIAARAISGKQRFDIRLDPADLGKIDVRLDIDKHGQVTSHLTVEKAETLDLLRRDAPQLERALQDAGLKTSGNGLQFSLQQQTTQQQDTGTTSQDTAQLSIVDETIAPDIIQRGYTQLAAARGGVDIRV